MTRIDNATSVAAFDRTGRATCGIDERSFMHMETFVRGTRSCSRCRMGLRMPAESPLSAALHNVNPICYMAALYLAVMAELVDALA